MKSATLIWSIDWFFSVSRPTRTRSLQHAEESAQFSLRDSPQLQPPAGLADNWGNNAKCTNQNNSRNLNHRETLTQVKLQIVIGKPWFCVSYFVPFSSKNTRNLNQLQQNQYNKSINLQGSTLILTSSIAIMQDPCPAPQDHWALQTSNLLQWGNLWPCPAAAPAGGGTS